LDYFNADISAGVSLAVIGGKYQIVIIFLDGRST
jgi:hypothetical protein